MMEKNINWFDERVGKKVLMFKGTVEVTILVESFKAAELLYEQYTSDELLDFRDYAEDNTELFSKLINDSIAVNAKLAQIKSLPYYEHVLTHGERTAIDHMKDLLTIRINALNETQKRLL